MRLSGNDRNLRGKRHSVIRTRIAFRFLSLRFNGGDCTHDYRPPALLSDRLKMGRVVSAATDQYARHNRWSSGIGQ